MPSCQFTGDQFKAALDDYNTNKFFSNLKYDKKLNIYQKIIIALVLMTVLACDSTPTQKNGVESMLIQNKSWPYRIKGQLYISDVMEDYKGNINYALGSFYPENTNEEIIVEFQKDFFNDKQIVAIFKKAKIFTEDENNSSEMFTYPQISTVFLGKPIVKNFYDEDSFFFQIEKIE